MATPAFKNVFGMAKSQIQAGIYNMAGDGPPVSGTTLASGYLVAGNGSLYQDTANGVTYVNEGDATNLYWTPIDFLANELLAWRTDFRDGVGKAVSDTAATVTLVGSGIRVFGQGIAETDSGLTVAIGEGGPIASLITTDEDEHLAALGVGITTSVPYQPDTHGPLTVDALIAMSSAITLRSLFIGFLGTVADALDPPATCSGTTITMVQDDMAGMIFDAELTDADGIFAPHNKSDEAASIETTACDCESTFPAAGTYVRLRVVIDEDGAMQCFVNKVLVFSVAAALDVDEECAPVLLIRSTSAATKTMLVKYFQAWGSRVAVA